MSMHRVFSLVSSVVVIAACSSAGDKSADSAADSSSPAAVGASAAGGATAGLVRDSANAGVASDTMRATATVRNASGRELGTLTLSGTQQGLTASGRLTGLPPGAHGIHLHTTGQCTPPFESAGAHWNPTNRQHGTQNPQGPHFGDFPNITVGADSSVNVQSTTPGGTLRRTNALMDADGAAIVVHAAADDDRTDPSGASGNRVACGVISGS